MGRNAGGFSGRTRGGGVLVAGTGPIVPAPYGRLQVNHGERQSRVRQDPTIARRAVGRLLSSSELRRNYGEDASRAVMAARTCLVTVTDLRGIRHSVEVKAETVFEAAARALPALDAAQLLTMGCSENLNTVQNGVVAGDDVADPALDWNVRGDAHALEWLAIRKPKPLGAHGNADAVPEVGSIRITRAALRCFTHENAAPCVLERHHEVLTGRTTEAVHQKEHLSSVCAGHGELRSTLANGKGRRDGPRAQRDTVRDDLLPTSPGPVHQRRNQLRRRGPAAVASHIDDKRVCPRVALYQLDGRLFVDRITERRHADVRHLPVVQPTTLGGLRGHECRCSLRCGAVNYEDATTSGLKGNLFRKQDWIREDMRTCQTFIGRMNVPSRLANELLNRSAVDGAYHGARSQPRLPACDDDPPTFDLQKPKLQRTRVCVAVDELCMAIAEAGDEPQRSAREVGATTARQRVGHELAIRCVHL